MFIIKPSEEARRAQIRAALWTVIVLPFLIIGFGAPFRGFTRIRGDLLDRSLTFRSDESRRLIEALPVDLILGIIGAIVAAFCGSIALSTLRTQRLQPGIGLSLWFAMQGWLMARERL